MLYIVRLSCMGQKTFCDLLLLHQISPRTQYLNKLYKSYLQHYRRDGLNRLLSQTNPRSPLKVLVINNYQYGY
uniref:Uncharacterized protein n=1 Tax=uncultured marine virus TaxID=186617 RepID=A0A0F7L9U5_9VIRU|nr:hypothetical protein [uncultured marine virus]